MKTLYKVIISVVILGFLNACAVYPPNRYYSSSHNYYGRGQQYGNQGNRYANNRYPGYRNPYPNYGYAGYQRSPYGYNRYNQRPYCPDDD